MKKITLTKNHLIAGAILAAMAAAAGYGYFRYGSVAQVNGQPISRIAYYQMLDRTYRESTVEKMVQEALIRQEAAKKNIVISDEEIEGEFKKIEENLKANNMTLEQAMEAQGIDRANLSGQIKMQLTVNKLVGSDLKVEDKEIDEYLKTNQKLLPKDKSKDELRTMAREQLLSEKIADAASEWYAKVRSEAKIIYK